MARKHRIGEHKCTVVTCWKGPAALLVWDSLEETRNAWPVLAALRCAVAIANKTKVKKMQKRDECGQLKSERLRLEVEVMHRHRALTNIASGQFSKSHFDSFSPPKDPNLTFVLALTFIVILTPHRSILSFNSLSLLIPLAFPIHYISGTPSTHIFI